MNFADHEEMAERQKRRVKRRKSDQLWNILTGLVIIATVLLVGGLMLIYSNPYIALNPFPPPTMPVLVVYPTSTPTLVNLPSTWTPTPKLTETPRSTSTMVTPQTPVPTIPTIIVTTPTQTISTPNTGSLYPFALEGSPAAMANIVFRPNSSCDWQGVAGRVVDIQGRPLVGIRVVLKGTYNGKTIDMASLSGEAASTYGESGYEFQLGTKAIASTGLLSVQLNDQSFLPISDRVIFDTFATCDKNLILINFKQVR